MTDPNRTSAAPPQIINLFEALKDSLHQTTEQNRERVQADQTSVGDVPAPSDDELQRAVDVCVEAGERNKARRRQIDALDLCTSCGAHWPYDDRLQSAEKLASHTERAAVVKYLRDEADELSATGSETLDVVAQSLRARAGHIEKGEHLK